MNHRRQAIITLRRFETLANVHLRRIGLPAMPELRVDWYASGAAAGRAYLRQYLVKLHDVMLRENVDAFCACTVPHEVAHIVAFHLAEHGHCSMKEARSHGRVWSSIQSGWFGADASRCHRYDMSHVNVKRQRRWEYACKCRTHAITTVRHNKAQRDGASYRCRECSTRIAFTGKRAA